MLIRRKRGVSHFLKFQLIENECRKHHSYFICVEYGLKMKNPRENRSCNIVLTGFALRGDAFDGFRFDKAFKSGFQNRLFIVRERNRRVFNHNNQLIFKKYIIRNAFSKQERMRDEHESGRSESGVLSPDPGMV